MAVLEQELFDKVIEYGRVGTKHITMQSRSLERL